MSHTENKMHPPAHTLNDSYKDTPSHQVGITSSIGALWPPAPASFNRIKGFYDKTIKTKKELASLVSFVQQEYDKQSETDNEARISIRALVDKKVKYGNLAQYIEVELELDDNRKVAYIGINGEKRKSNPADRETCLELINRAVNTPSRDYKTMLENCVQNGYELHIYASPHARTTPNITQQLAQLYDRFGWKERDVREMLENKSNVFGVVQKDDNIICAAIAEKASVPVDKKDFTLVEITEAATHEHHMKKGLYAAVSTMLIAHFYQHDMPDVIYGECNGLAPGVLKTSALQGRTFARQQMEKRGLKNRGILEQHVPISGSVRQTAYNDLFPTYCTEKSLNNRCDFTLESLACIHK